MEDDSRQNKGGPPAAMATMMLTIPPARIALFKAIIESYDNLATLRTDDPQTHRLKLYFAPESTDEIEELVGRLSGEFALDRIG